MRFELSSEISIFVSPVALDLIMVMQEVQLGYSLSSSFPSTCSKVHLEAEY